MEAIQSPPHVEDSERTECVENMACSCATTPFMPVKEAVAVLPVSKAYLYSGLRTGRFPGTSFGRGRVLLRTFVEEFVTRAQSGDLTSFEEYAAEWRARNNAEATA
jgi:hypothetical protein